MPGPGCVRCGSAQPDLTSTPMYFPLCAEHERETEASMAELADCFVAPKQPHKLTPSYEAVEPRWMSLPR